MEVEISAVALYICFGDKGYVIAYYMLNTVVLPFQYTGKL